MGGGFGFGMRGVWALRKRCWFDGFVELRIKGLWFRVKKVSGFGWFRRSLEEGNPHFDAKC